MLYKRLVLMLSLLLSANAATAETLKSPSGNLALDFALQDQDDLQGRPLYSISHQGEPVILPSVIGYLVDGVALDRDFAVVESRTASVDETWKPVYGERSTVRDRYNQLTVTLRRTIEPIYQLQIEFRAYDTGIAWRTRIDRPDNPEEKITINREETVYQFAADHPCWTSKSAQGGYHRVPISGAGGRVERPVTVEASPELYVAIAEAALVDAARMQLKSAGAGVFGTTLGSHVVGTGPYTMPWRVVMIAESPGKLLEGNDLIRNLNEPCAIEDTSWIRPGKVIREISLTTDGSKVLVDFAVKHNLQYVHFDAGWYGHEYNNRSNATTVTVDPHRSPGPLDLPEVIRYANERNIGVILYVNQKALDRQLDAILPLYQSWGIKGVKFGFVRVGSQLWTGWLHEAVRKAAQHEIMVDVHDEYRPTGYSRTYPNLMTQEGISGDEARPSSTQTLTVLFTRMLAGAGDNTVCYFDPRVDQIWSHGYQLAKSVCIYSPWQYLYWYDRPADAPQHIDPSVRKPLPVISEEPELAFFDALPTVWDDSKVIHGSIGEYAVIARRSGDSWFIGAMNGPNERSLDVPLDFLDANKTYTATIYGDDESLDTRTKVRITEQQVTAKDVLVVALNANGGEAVHLVAND